MPSAISAVDSYEAIYEVQQRALPGRRKPARRYSPRYERPSRRGPKCPSGIQFRGNKQRAS